MIDFEKYQGAGNDFILIDNTAQLFNGNKVAFAKKWCNRKYGIGSDGLIFIEKSKLVDFKMDFYNPDGSQSFCGNGSRCAVVFAQKLGLISENSVFEALGESHQATINGDLIKIEMSVNSGIERIGDDYYMNTGSPHYISYCKGLPQLNIVEIGRNIRYNERFKESGTNVNLVEVIGENKIAIRTYERGVEDETLACGTGATACALSYAMSQNLKMGKIEVQVEGGELAIYFEHFSEEDNYENVWLEGPAEFVFKGILNE